MVNCTSTTDRRRRSVDAAVLKEFDVFVDLTMIEIIEKDKNVNGTDIELNNTSANTIDIKEQVNFIIQEALQEIVETVKNETGIDLDRVEV